MHVSRVRAGKLQRAGNRVDRDVRSVALDRDSSMKRRGPVWVANADLRRMFRSPDSGPSLRIEIASAVACGETSVRRLVRDERGPVCGRRGIRDVNLSSSSR